MRSPFAGPLSPAMGISVKSLGGGAAPIPTIASAVYWLDATDASTIGIRSDAGVDYVSEIRDRLGGTKKMAQGEGSLQPTTGVATINGLNALYFLTSDARLGMNTMLTEKAAVAVSMLINTTDDKFLLLFGENGAFAGVGEDGSSNTALGQNAGTPSYFVNGTHLAAMTRDGFHAMVSGAGGQVIVTITAVNMTQWPQLVIFYYGSGGFGLVGSLGEMVVMNAPSNSELNALGSYLAAKWGTPAWSDIS
jgi:hypothetical protein